jgi:hypothetical protein
MDDFVLFAWDKERLAVALDAVRTFLREGLHLDLKEPATVLAPVHQGLPFLGWRIHRGTLRLRPQYWRRMRSRLKHRLWQHRTGRIDLPRLLACLRSFTEHLRHGSTLQLRRKWLSPILSPPRSSAFLRALRVPAVGSILPRVAMSTQSGGSGSQGSSNRVNRGGGFDNDASNARSANRNNDAPSNADDNQGVRPAKTSTRPIAVAAARRPRRRASDVQTRFLRR